jgi:hypothetical protein
MKVELDFEELDLVLEALHDKHVACSESIDFLPKVLAVNRLYNRLIELSEEYETSRRLETFAKGLAKEALQRAANVKDRDGRVKPLEECKDNSSDNEMDGQDAIKLYNELVKSPEDRLALEKEIPSLIAARDKAVTAAKQKQLQKETAQMLEQVAQDAQMAQGHLSI